MHDIGSERPAIKLVGAVTQAIALLRVLAASRKPMGVSAAAREAKINTSTAFNILRTLAAERLVSFDEVSKTYQLASGLFELAKGIGSDLPAVLKAELSRISEITGCLMVLWEIVGDRAVLSDRVVPDRPIGLNMVTRRMPILLGAVGRATAAAMKPELNEIKRRFGKLRWQAEVTLSEYLDDVRSARSLGYAVDRGRLYLGITSVASVITDEGSAPIYGISAIEMSVLLDEKRTDMIGRELAAVARGLSATQPSLHAPSADTRPLVRTEGREHVPEFSSVPRSRRKAAQSS